MGILVATSVGLMVPPPPTVHADTQAAIVWLYGQGVTLTTLQTDTLDRHVRDLHGYINPNYATTDIWAKIRAIYPMIGGTAVAHALNLRNTAQPLTFNGGVSHSATGAQFNGSTGYATCGFNMASQPTAAGGGYYSRSTGLIQAGALMGTGWDGGHFMILFNPPDTFALSAVIYGYSTDRLYTSVPAGIAGYCSMSRVNVNDLRLFKNGAQVGATKTETLVGVPTGTPLNIGNNGGSSGDFYSPTECAYANINYGLTPAEELNYYNSIQAYQTALGRAIVPSLLAITLVLIGVLLSLGITLTLNQQLELDALIRSIEDGIPAISGHENDGGQPLFHPAVLEFLNALPPVEPETDVDTDDSGIVV